MRKVAHTGAFFVPAILQNSVCSSARNDSRQQNS